jgi:hypothetical protein
MTGVEYITASVLEALWIEIADAFRSELVESKASARSFFKARAQAQPGITMNRGAKVRRTTAQRTAQSDQAAADREDP